MHVCARPYVGGRDDRLKIVGNGRKFERIDILVNNAGVAPLIRADLLDMTEESFDRVISVNTKEPCFLTQAVAKQMISGDPVARVLSECIRAARRGGR